jgi:transposase
MPLAMLMVASNFVYMELEPIILGSARRLVKVSETRGYVEKRRAEGKTDKEIRRCVMRYLARRTFRILTAVAQTKRVQEAT